MIEIRNRWKCERMKPHSRLRVDEIELDDNGHLIAAKGKVIRVVEIDDLPSTFLSHRFSLSTLKTMFWAYRGEGTDEDGSPIDGSLDYCGG